MTVVVDSQEKIKIIDEKIEMINTHLVQTMGTDVEVAAGLTVRA